MTDENTATSQGEVCETVHSCWTELVTAENAGRGTKGIATLDLAKFLSLARRGKSLYYWSIARQRMYVSELDSLGIDVPAIARDFDGKRLREAEEAERTPLWIVLTAKEAASR